MQKYNLEIDVTKITKDKLEKRSYKDKSGTEVHQTNLKAVVVLGKDKVLAEGPTWILREVGFVAEQGSKDEKSNYIGRVTEFLDKKEELAEDPVFGSIDYPADDINPEDIPF